MDNYPSILGGWDGDCAGNFEAFWKTYEPQDGGHPVFSHHADRLGKVVPLILHGDEGRAVKRTNYLVVSMESPLGSMYDPTLRCTCQSELCKRPGVPSYGSDQGTLSPETLEISRKMVTNFKGHSYLAHFLLFGAGGWLYKKHPHIVDELFAELTINLRRLFFDGVKLADGSYIYGAIIAIKGDMDFHKKAFRLTRSYANLGRTNAIEICHQCLAGGPRFDFEDYAEDPQWLQSMYSSRPWPLHDPPPLAGIIADPSCPERLLQGDLFHILKLGVSRDVIGGVLILLVRLGFMDFPGCSKDIKERLNRAHSWFTMWCKSEGKHPGLRSFTKAFFNIKTLVSAPWANCKGSDSIILLQWLQYMVNLYLLQCPGGHALLLQHMAQVIDACLGVRIIHQHPLWMERACGKMLYIHLMTILRGYSVLGQSSIRLKIRCFLQKPKHHALHHVAMSIKQELEKGSTLILNPQAMACETCEDFLGRISRLSRKVGFRLVNLRVAERYFLKIHALLKTRKVNKIWAGKKKKRRNWNFIESYAMFGLVVADDFHTSYKKFLKGHLASTYPIRLHPFPAISPQSYAWSICSMAVQKVQLVKEKVVDLKFKGGWLELVSALKSSNQVFSTNCSTCWAYFFKLFWWFFGQFGQNGFRRNFWPRAEIPASGGTFSLNWVGLKLQPSEGLGIHPGRLTWNSSSRGVFSGSMLIFRVVHIVGMPVGTLPLFPIRCGFVVTSPKWLAKIRVGFPKSTNFLKTRFFRNEKKGPRKVV